MFSGQPLIIDDYVRFAANLVELLDVGVFVSDLEKIIYYQPSSSFDLKMQIGLPIKLGMASHVAIHERRRVVMRKDNSYSGQPFITIVIPLYDESQAVIGTLAVTEPVDRQDKLRGLAQKLSDDLGVLSAATTEILARTEKVTAVAENMVVVNRQSQQRVAETDQVLGIIKSIAGQTNLLGLNAAIEAARVGDQGRGFGVVADEIRKLAVSSSESIAKIGEILSAVKESSGSADQATADIRDTLGQVASDITRIAGAIQETGALAVELDKIAEDIVK